MGFYLLYHAQTHRSGFPERLLISFHNLFRARRIAFMSRQSAILYLIRLLFSAGKSEFQPIMASSIYDRLKLFIILVNNGLMFSAIRCPNSGGTASPICYARRAVQTEYIIRKSLDAGLLPERELRPTSLVV
jgi:hypothetical protein